MKVRIFILLLLLALPAWPGPGQEQPPEVFIEGTALDSSEGPCVLQASDCLVFIDGLPYWPPGFYDGGRNGKRVICRGQLVERYDLPVYEDKQGAEKRQGIPVPPGTDLHEASRRYLLQFAQWDEWRVTTDPLRDLTPVNVTYDEDSGLQFKGRTPASSLAVLRVSNKVHLKKLNSLVKELNDKGFATVKLEFLAPPKE